MIRPGKSYALFKDLEDLPKVAQAAQTAQSIVPLSPEPDTDHADLATPAQAAAAHQQLWLALRFYDLPLEVLCRGQTHDCAIAVVAEQQGKSCVIACNQIANDLGVQAQMKLSAAYALAPALLSLPQNMAQEQVVLERLGAWAKRFTPFVSLQAPQGLLLEIKGSLALFGGLEKLVQKVQEDLQALGFQHQLAAAPTPTAALWLAQDRDGQLAQDAEALHTLLGNLPVSCTAWPADVLNRLQGLGVRCLRDCMRLPRDGFARRMGKQRLLDLDRALGKTPDPRVNYLPPDKFVAKREFLFSLERVDMIFFGLEKLLAELSGFLRGRQAGIQTLKIRLYHQYAPASSIDLGMAAVCRDRQRMAALLHEKLEQLQLPAAVVAVTMVSGILYPLAGSDGELFNDSAHRNVHWPELVEKLRARLGVRAVSGLCLVPEHRPEQAWAYIEPGAEPARETGTGAYNRRPVWVLTQPCRMPLRQGQPHWQGVLTRLQGPERIETGWWDGQDVARDYFIVSNPGGLCLWIYRERVPQRDAAKPVHTDDESRCETVRANTRSVAPPHAHDRWYLHGIFA